MASRFIGLNRGQTEFDIVEGASTGSKDVELRVDTGKSLTKNEVTMMLRQIASYLTTKNTTIPPSNVPAV